jgi:hypothetical protein
MAVRKRRANTAAQLPRPGHSVQGMHTLAVVVSFKRRACRALRAGGDVRPASLPRLQWVQSEGDVCACPFAAGPWFPAPTRAPRSKTAGLSPVQPPGIRQRLAPGEPNSGQRPRILCILTRTILAQPLDPLLRQYAGPVSGRAMGMGGPASTATGLPATPATPVNAPITVKRFTCCA